MTTSIELMAETLDKVKEIVSGDRNADYGDPIDNHERTARFWVEYLRHRISVTPTGAAITLNGRDVCWLNVLQKISRECHCAKHDNAIDVCGYAANAAACMEETG